MIRTIIIDDETKGRQVLQQMLTKYCPSIEIVSMASTAKEGRKAITEHHPDLVFLDVEMPHENGFEMLEHFQQIDFNIIFVTAHHHYAINAIRVSALDYLLKPVNLKELKAAVEKAESKTKNEAIADQMNVLLQNLKNVHPKIGLPTRNGLVFVQIEDIIRCESDSNYTTIHLTSREKYVAAKTLKEFDELLSKHEFIRIHQSHLINASHIKQYVRGDGGSVILSNGSSIEVSRRHKEQLLQRIAHL